jgi:hypothetical protein
MFVKQEYQVPSGMNALTSDDQDMSKFTDSDLFGMFLDTDSLMIPTLTESALSSSDMFLVPQESSQTVPSGATEASSSGASPYAPAAEDPKRNPFKSISAKELPLLAARAAPMRSSGGDDSDDASNDGPSEDPNDPRVQKRRAKNRDSARRSRLRKQERMSELEKKVEEFAEEKEGLQRRVNDLESANRCLREEITRLQQLAASRISGRAMALDAAHAFNGAGMVAA